MNKPPERIRTVMNRYGCIFPDLAPTFEWDRDRPDFTPHTEHFYVLEKEPMEKKTEDIANGGKVYADWDRIRDSMKKTENLTEKEAWIAMANGECVKAFDYVHRIDKTVLEFFNAEKWLACCEISPGPYSIVPDPSKPKEVENDYILDRDTVKNNIEHAVNSANSYADQAIISTVRSLFDFIERNFQRKQ